MQDSCSAVLLRRCCRSSSFFRPQLMPYSLHKHISSSSSDSGSSDDSNSSNSSKNDSGTAVSRCELQHRKRHNEYSASVILLSPGIFLLICLFVNALEKLPLFCNCLSVRFHKQQLLGVPLCGVRTPQHCTSSIKTTSIGDSECLFSTFYVPKFVALISSLTASPITASTRETLVKQQATVQTRKCLTSPAAETDRSRPQNPVTSKAGTTTAACTQKAASPAIETGKAEAAAAWQASTTTASGRSVAAVSLQLSSLPLQLSCSPLIFAPPRMRIFLSANKTGGSDSSLFSSSGTDSRQCKCSSCSNTACLEERGPLCMLLQHVQRGVSRILENQINMGKKTQLLLQQHNGEKQLYRQQQHLQRKQNYEQQGKQQGKKQRAKQCDQQPHHCENQQHVHKQKQTHKKQQGLRFRHQCFYEKKRIQEGSFDELTFTAGIDAAFSPVKVEANVATREYEVWEAPPSTCFMHNGDAAADSATVAGTKGKEAFQIASLIKENYLGSTKLHNVDGTTHRSSSSSNCSNIEMSCRSRNGRNCNYSISLLDKGIFCGGSGTVGVARHGCGAAASRGCNLALNEARKAARKLPTASSEERSIEEDGKRYGKQIEDQVQLEEYVRSSKTQKDGMEGELCTGIKHTEANQEGHPQDPVTITAADSFASGAGHAACLEKSPTFADEPASVDAAPSFNHTANQTQAKGCMHCATAGPCIDAATAAAEKTSNFFGAADAAFPSPGSQLFLTDNSDRKAATPPLATGARAAESQHTIDCCDKKLPSSDRSAAIPKPCISRSNAESSSSSHNNSNSSGENAHIVASAAVLVATEQQKQQLQEQPNKLQHFKQPGQFDKPESQHQQQQQAELSEQQQQQQQQLRTEEKSKLLQEQHQKTTGVHQELHEENRGTYGEALFAKEGVLEQKRVTETPQKKNSKKSAEAAAMRAQATQAIALRHLQKRYRPGHSTFRIQRELKTFLQSPPPNCRVHVHPKNLRIWVIEIKGVEGSAYAGETYRMKIVFPDDYPFKPPTCFFLKPTPVHPHVYSNGDICLNLLGADWQPSLSVSAIAVAILSMLSTAKSKQLPTDNAQHVDVPAGHTDTQFLYHDDKI